MNLKIFVLGGRSLSGRFSSTFIYDLGGSFVSLEDCFIIANSIESF